MHSKDIGSYAFNYDNSMSGTTVIHDTNTNRSVELPTEFLVEFVGQLLASHRINTIEQQTGHQFLGLER